MKKCILGIILLINASTVLSNTIVCTFTKMTDVTLLVERGEFNFLKSIIILDSGKPARVADSLTDLAGTSVEEGTFFSGTISTNEYFKKGAPLELFIDDSDNKVNAKVKVGKGPFKKRLNAICEFI